MGQHTTNQIDPFGEFIVQLGDLPAFGVSRLYGGYSYYETLEDAVDALEKHWQFMLRSYTRSCPGRTHAISILATVEKYRYRKTNPKNLV